jgi:CheY-like chemotaxis protein
MDPKPQNKKRKTLLIADDEPYIRLLIRQIFEENYLVFEAANGEDAVNLALRKRPDIILMDVLMPRVDGLTALSKIKGDARTAAIPVIMLTGVGFDLNERLAGSLGAQGYLKKPATPQSIIDAVFELVESEPENRT